MTDTKIRAQIY